MFQLCYFHKNGVSGKVWISTFRTSQTHLDRSFCCKKTNCVAFLTHYNKFFSFCLYHRRQMKKKTQNHSQLKWPVFLQSNNVPFPTNVPFDNFLFLRAWAKIPSFFNPYLFLLFFTEMERIGKHGKHWIITQTNE